MTTRAPLLFVSTRFLFPVDSGGKIRTTQILRGLKAGRFRVTLLSPASPELVADYSDELDSICDEFRWWPAPRRGRLFNYTRLRFLTDALPVPVRTDRQPMGMSLVQELLDQNPSVVVFDFSHAAVLAPDPIPSPSVMFTHNVEAEIFHRHYKVAKTPIGRALWGNQYRKMRAFEKASLKKFDVVVAVSDRDARQFQDEYGISNTFVIPTGVDLDFFSYKSPKDDPRIVFCGSMDWLANQEAIGFFMDEIWDRIAAQVPNATMTVVGRAPPARIVKAAAGRDYKWTFTHFVDDVRPHMQGAAVSIIPLRVGGGTRLKAYESMAMGIPLVSTSIGVEGLPIDQGKHYLEGDDPEAFAGAVVDLLLNKRRREAISRAARQLVEEKFSYRNAASEFEKACLLACDNIGWKVEQSIT